MACPTFSGANAVERLPGVARDFFEFLERVFDISALSFERFPPLGQFAEHPFELCFLAESGIIKIEVLADLGQ